MLRLLPVRQRGQRPDRARSTTATRAGAVHLPAAAARPAAVPGRLLQAARARAQTDVVAFQLATMGPRISRGHRPSCSPRTPTASTWSCTACPSSSPRRWPSTGTPGSGASCGISGADPDDLDGFFRVDYRGARYSFGYPACPDLADRAKVVRLLEPSRIGVELSEEMQLASRAVHRRDRRAPSRGEVLQRLRPMGRRHGRPVRHGRAADRLRAAVARGRDGVMARLGGSWTEADQAQLLGGSLERSVRYLLSKAAQARAAGTGRRVADVRHRRARPPRAASPIQPGARELLAAVRRRACRTRW